MVRLFFTMIKTDLCDFEKSLIIWESGNFAKPICILGKHDIKELKKELDKEVL